MEKKYLQGRTGYRATKASLGTRRLLSITHLREAAIEEVEQTDGPVFQGGEHLQDERSAGTEQQQGGHGLTEEQLGD